MDSPFFGDSVLDQNIFWYKEEECLLICERKENIDGSIVTVCQNRKLYYAYGILNINGREIGICQKMVREEAEPSFFLTNINELVEQSA